VSECTILSFDYELGDIVSKNDMDTDGKLSFEDFYNVLTKKSFE